LSKYRSNQKLGIPSSLSVTCVGVVLVNISDAGGADGTAILLEVDVMVGVSSFRYRCVKNRCAYNMTHVLMPAIKEFRRTVLLLSSDSSSSRIYMTA
jgi:hypothetical protein